MATLHVRNVPERIYTKIQAMAGKAKRSFSAEVVDLLDQAVADRERWSKQKKILDDIRRHRFQLPEMTAPSEDWIREDRDRS